LNVSKDDALGARRILSIWADGLYIQLRMVEDKQDVRVLTSDTWYKVSWPDAAELSGGLAGQGERATWCCARVLERQLS